MAKEQRELKKDNFGLSSLAIKLIAYAVTVFGIIATANGPSNIVYFNYLSWISYPIFAFCIAVGFDETSSRLRYFLRLLIFALLSEIPYDYLKTGSFFSLDYQNGMLTLLLGYIILVVVCFVEKRTRNIVLSGLLTYFMGYGFYWFSRYLNFECYSFGIMFVIMFYVSRHCKYTKLMQCAFVAFLVFIVTSENSLSFIIGNIQYSMPFRAYSMISLIIIWFYNEKQGPNKLWLTISEYCFYPLLLIIACIYSYLL